MSMISEFREFAVKGNMMDMAVGIIIGGAFGKVVSSLVNDVLMPPLGVLIGNVNFSELAITIKAGVEGGAAPVMLKYGSFIQTLLDFLIVAWAIFMLVKVMNRLRRMSEHETKKEAAK